MALYLPAAVYISGLSLIVALQDVLDPLVVHIGE